MIGPLFRIHVLLLCGVAALAFASPCFSWTSVGHGIEYQSFKTADPNNVFVCRMARGNLNATIESTLANGKICGGNYQTMPNQAVLYDDTISWWGEEWGARNDVVCAINGERYDGSGILYNQHVSSGWYAKRMTPWQAGSGFGWTTDRLAFIGGCVKFETGQNYITVLPENIQIEIDKLNATRGANETVIYTPQFDSTTKTDNTGVEWVVQMDRPTLILAAPNMAEGTVTGIRVNQAGAPIPWDCIVISATGTDATTLQGYLSVGKRVGITQFFSHYENDCGTPQTLDWARTFASGGGNFTFLKNGLIQPTSDLLFTTLHPRTAIALNDDYVFYIVVDGRTSSSIGMNMAQLGQWCLDNLQATDGTNLDGGGSSTMVVNGVVKNSPSDGSPRSVPNGMLMVNVAPRVQSTTFSAGQTVTVNTASTAVRLGPGANYASTTTVGKNATGTVTSHASNGVYAKGYCWWRVDFGGGIVGWVAETLISSSGTGPIVLQHPVSQAACLESSLKLSVVATGKGAISYRWQKNEVDLADGGHYSGTATSKLLITDVSSADLAGYRCRVTDSVGSVYSNSATLTLGIQPAVPGALPATNIDTDSITWNWSAVAGADYRLWTAASGGTQIGGLITTDSYTETAMNPSTAYTRYVEALACGPSASRRLLGPATTLPSYCPVNPGFEEGFTNGIGNHWNKMVDDGTSTFAESTTIKNSGNSSQRISDPSLGQSYTGWLYQKLHVQPSRQYRLSYWHYHTGLAGQTTGFVTEIGCDVNGGTTLSSIGQSAGPLNQWLQKKSNPFTSGTGGIITIGVRGGFNNGGSTGYVDDFELAPAPPTSSSGSTTVYAGQSATITASGGFGGTPSEMHWYTGPVGTGTHAGTGTSLSVTPMFTTTYYPRWESASTCGGCCNSDDGPAVTITVLHVTPTVTSIDPPSGPNTGATSVTNLSGTNFISGAGVRLSRAGCTDIDATSVAVESATKITCLIDLTNKKTGLWDVVVTNPDATSAVLEDGFGIAISESAKVVGTSISSLLDAAVIPACLDFQFCVWGVVEVIDSSMFWLDDGSGTRIKVFAPGYAGKGITSGSYASAVGTVDASAVTPIMVSTQSKVQKY